MLTAITAAVLSACASQPTMVQLPPGAKPARDLRPWHPEPFGDADLARSLGLDRWYISESGRVPANAQAWFDDEPVGTVAAFPSDPAWPVQWNLHGAPFDTEWLATWELAGELIDSGRTPEPVRIALCDTALWGSLGDLPVTAYWNAMNGTRIHAPLDCPHAVSVISVGASITNNGIGMAGTCPWAEVTAIQVLGGVPIAPCSGNYSWLAYGTVYAADSGARVINYSLQFPQTTPLLTSSVLYAAVRGCIMVAASGNTFWTSSTAYPAQLPEVIGVGAIASDGTRPPWSNAGPDLELCAPGVAVPALTSTGAIKPMDGTSLASPQVWGAAALILAFYPQTEPEAVRAILTAAADDMGPPGHDPEFGHGRLNIYRALHAANLCYADFNDDGALSVADVGAFQTAFMLKRHRANCTADLTTDDRPILTVADFGCFQSRFTAGCN